VKQLQDELKDRDLKVAGVKSELVQRLVDSDAKGPAPKQRSVPSLAPLQAAAEVEKPKWNGREVTKPLGLMTDVPNVPVGKPYSKELRLLKHVFETATRNDPVSVCNAIESYGTDTLGPTSQWLKIAGDVKTLILTNAMGATHPRGAILEVGCYCGYSSSRMAVACPKGHILTLEVDPVHVIVARNVHLFGGVSDRVDVWTGHSKDLVARIEGRYGGPGELHIGGVFFDQKGSRYDEDLVNLEKQGMLLPGALVVADNVLKPGAPIWCWRLSSGAGAGEAANYYYQFLSMNEFAMASEDWMTMSVRRTLMPPVQRQEWPRKPLTEEDLANMGDETNPLKQRLPMEGMPVPPQELKTANWECDRVRERAFSAVRSVTFQEWSEFAADLKKTMAEHGLDVTVDATTASG
jgi:catechol O-methyltransferase